MKLEFALKKMTVSSFNPRAELHGESREPAADIHLTTDVPNDFLNELQPGLKESLYYFDDSRGGQADLADQARAGEPGYRPHLKFPALALKSWDDEMTGAQVFIRPFGSPASMEFQAAKINQLKLEPKDGGTVSISIRVQCHPDKQQSGELAHLVQKDVEVSIAEAPEPQGEITKELEATAGATASTEVAP